LTEAILANREADAQQASRDQRRLENEQRERLQQPGDAQQRLSRHAQANKLAQADAHASAALSQIALAHHRLVAHAKTEFPELTGKSADEQAAIVARMSPGRQHQFVTMDAHARQLEGAANAWQGERARYSRISSGLAQHAARQQFDSWANTQDAIATQKIPELAGGDSKAMQDASVEVLREAGYSDQEIARAWNSDPRLRDARTQILIASAARQKIARRQLEQAKVTKPTPRLMRPGNGHRNSDAGERSLADLSAKLSATGKLKDAVALRAAKRRAAARSH
jgi:hypothetical protein